MLPSLPAALKPWLKDSASFMERARAHSLDPQIQVLRQSWGYPSEDERQYLQLPLRQYVFSREVLIHHQTLPLLYAKALIPRTTLKGQGRQLQFLGNQALGSFLFAQPDLERSSFEFKDYSLPDYSPTPCWGRQSAFYFQNKQLLLTEVFLPGLLDHL